jgi:lysine 2,3-aminomutase
MERWLQENKDAITDPAVLEQHIPVSKKELSQFEKLNEKFRMKIPPYYIGLIDPDDPNDPIRKMCIPSPKELKVKEGELLDPIGDTNEQLCNQPVKAITHRYPDRALLYPTPLCGGYCRHCFRRRLAGKQEFSLTSEQLETAFRYLETHTSIHEVILTGGDPLMLTDDKLLSILRRLRAMPHIWTLRIHSRMLVFNPFRITDRLAEKLKEFHPLWIVTHFNHPREVTEVAIKHVQKLIDRGIPVLNQSVLLKGVNDDTETQRQLVWDLIRARVKPYYIHHLDKAQGISHFRVGIRRGVKLLKDLRGTVPGYAIPHYILDIPGGYGKIPLQYHYLNSDDKGHIIVESPEEQLQVYVDNVEKMPDDLEEIEEIEPFEMYSDKMKEKIEELKEKKLEQLREELFAEVVSHA